MTDILYGMEQIRPILNNISDATILKLKREYESFPIRKLGQQWASHKGELCEWWRLYVIGEDVDKIYLSKKTTKVKKSG